MSALGVPAFRRLWLAGMVCDTGDWLLLVSLPILVYQLTGSTLGTAVAFLIELVPPVLLAPLAGWLADHLERRRTLVVVSLAQAAALLPLLVSHALITVYAVIAVQATLATLFEPAKNALLPTLVGPDQLVSANSMVGLNQNLGRLIGGPLGGLLLAFGELPAIVAVDAASFLLAALLILGIRPAGPAPVVGAARSGAVTSRPRVGRALAVVALAGVAQGLFVVLFVVFVARVLHGDAAETGLLRGVQAIGAIGGGLLLALTGRVRPGRLAGYAALGFGVLDLAVWNAPRLSTAEPLYVVLFIAVGAPGIAMTTGMVSFLQESTVEGQRGRVFAMFGAASAVGQGVGELAGGVLGDRLGVINVLNGQAGLCLLAGALGLAWLGTPGRPLRRRATPAAEDRAGIILAAGLDQR
jgi:MFS family permease